MTCSIGCALFCSKRLCNYADNEVYCLVALKVLLGFKAGGVASQAISKVAQTCRYLCVWHALSDGRYFVRNDRVILRVMTFIIYKVYKVYTVVLGEGTWSCVKIPRPDL